VIVIADNIQLYPEEKYQKGMAMVTCCHTACDAGGSLASGEILKLSEQHHGQSSGIPVREPTRE